MQPVVHFVSRLIRIAGLHWRPMFVLGISLLVGSYSIQNANSEEPYVPFLEKLRDQRLYDLALSYVDDLQKGNQVAPQFAVEIPLERARLLQESAASMAPKSSTRAARLDEAERAFQSFLDTRKDHPRRSEARLGLGNLLLNRGEEAAMGGDSSAAQSDAIKFYSDAQVLFESAKKELAEILNQIKGAKLDPSDEVRKAQRDRLRDDYRRAELLAAFATEKMGRSQAAGSTEWKTNLAKAEKLYTELYNHEKERVEARNYALYYRSAIQRDFGKLEDAIDGFNRIISIEGIDELRPLQFKSLTEIVKLWASKELGKLPLAVELASKWEKQIRPDEKASQDVIDFLLALARAKIDYASLLQAKDPDDRSTARLRKEARETVQKLARVSGSHQTNARELMGEIGVAKDRPEQPLELPKVKNFNEALKEAINRFDLIDNTELPEQQALTQKLDSTNDESQKVEINAQLAKANGRLDRIRDQIAELLKQGIRMFPKGEELAELTDARFRLAYIEIQRGNNWDAIAIGEFLAQTNAGSDTGLNHATVALVAYRNLINEANLEQQKALAGMLQPLAEFMVKTWPNSNEAQSAASTVVQLAMNGGDFEKARSYLDKLPKGTGKSDKLRREIGLVMASQFVQEKSKLAEGAKLSEELIAKRDSALEQLDLATRNLKKDELDSRWIEAINDLVYLQMTSGKSDQAIKWYGDAELSPVKAIRNNPDLVDQPSVKLETFRTALQATASQIANSNNPAEVLKQMEKLLAELQSAAGKDVEGQKLLNSNLILVARDMQDLIVAADTPAKKQKMAESLAIVCRQISDGTDDFAKKLWAGSTLAKIGETLDDPTKPGKGALQREAIAILESILQKESQKPGWISTPNGEIGVRVRLAKALRQSRQFEEALAQIAKVLEKNPSVLDMQMEAAEIYQTWGDSGNPDKYHQAINGGAGNAIWGWAKISKALTGKSEHVTQFFECRYNLALCTYKAALAQKNAASKKKELEKAEREINSTVLLYPDLGGDPKRFDTLLKTIQKDLGKAPTGIKTKIEKANS